MEPKPGKKTTYGVLVWTEHTKSWDSIHTGDRYRPAREVYEDARITAGKPVAFEQRTFEIAGEDEGE